MTSPTYVQAIVGSMTNHRCDARRHAALLRAFKGQPEGPAILRAILDGRAAWLDWLTVTQRQWQCRTRRPARARFHDSVSIREKYVRGER